MKTTPQIVATLFVFACALPLAHGQQVPTAKPAVPAAGVAAPPLPAGAPTPPPPGAPHPGEGAGPKHPRAGRVQELTSISGTLVAYTADNDEKVYDAFSLKTSNGTETVHFPRHMGQQLMAAAKPGSTVTISSFRDKDAQGRSVLHLVSATAGSRTVQNTPPTPPATPLAAETATVRGTIRTLRQGPDGRTNALLLSDGTVLRLPPPALAQLAEKLKAGTTLEATGTMRPKHPGEVAVATPVRVVEAETLTLNGVKFLVH